MVIFFFYMYIQSKFHNVINSFSRKIAGYRFCLVQNKKKMIYMQKKKGIKTSNKHKKKIIKISNGGPKIVM